MPAINVVEAHVGSSGVSVVSTPTGMVMTYTAESSISVQNTGVSTIVINMGSSGASTLALGTIAHVFSLFGE
jgi:hypothetical protein